MEKIIPALLLVALGLVLILNCSSTNMPDSNVVEKSTFFGQWAETDTSTGSEKWEFTDSAVVHFFKNMDTIGIYGNWWLKGDTILLNDGQRADDKINFKIIGENNVRFVYYRWALLVDKPYSKK